MTDVDQLDDEDAQKYELVSQIYGRWTVLLSGLTALGLGVAATAVVLNVMGTAAPNELTDPSVMLPEMRFYGTFLAVVLGLSVGNALSTVVWFSLRTPSEIRSDNPGIIPAAAVFGILVMSPLLYSLLWLLPLLAGVSQDIAIVLVVPIVAYAVYNTGLAWSYTLTEGLPAFQIGLFAIVGLLGVLAGIVTFGLGLWPQLPLSDYVVLGVYAVVGLNTLNGPKTYTMTVISDYLEAEIARAQVAEQVAEQIDEEEFVENFQEGLEEGLEEAVEEAADEATWVDEGGDDRAREVVERAGSLGESIALDPDGGDGHDPELYDDYLDVVERYQQARRAAPDHVVVDVDVGEAHPDDVDSAAVARDRIEAVGRRVAAYDDYASATRRIDDEVEGPLPAAVGGDDLTGLVATLAEATDPRNYDDAGEARRAAETLEVVAGAFVDARRDDATADAIAERRERADLSVSADEPPTGDDVEAVERVFVGDGDAEG